MTKLKLLILQLVINFSLCREIPVNSPILQDIHESRRNLDSFFQLSGPTSVPQEKSQILNRNEDDQQFTNNQFNDDTGSDPIDRQDLVTNDPAREYIPGLVLPITHRKETLQDIYVREKLPEIQRIIASGDQDEIARIIAENEEDPFTVLPNNLKYSQLLAADLFFSFLTKMVTWFVLISLLLPALVPIFTILSLVAELAALWLIPEV